MKKATQSIHWLNLRRLGRETAPPSGKAKQAGLRALLLFGVTLLSAGCVAGGGYPVEKRYISGGPYATTTASRTVTNASGKKVTYKLYYPKNYASLGFKSPIITWGNGTGGTADMYSTLLGHFASYGLTVVAADLKNTGSGNDIGEAARYMVSQNSKPSGNAFYQALDVKHVAAVGHSQGAGGVTGATLKNPAVITAVMTFSLPNKAWASSNPDCPYPKDCMHDVTKLKQPAFFISTRGLADAVIASPATEKAYFRSVSVSAALGIISISDGKPADHSSIQNKTNGGNPRDLMGYPTAWLAYRLLGDTTAANAFTGAKPEIVTNPNWNGSAVK